MNNKIKHFILLAFIILIFVSCTKNESIGLVEKVNGKVYINSKVAKIGDGVNEKDIVITDKHSTIIISFLHKESILEIQENAKVEIANYVNSKDSIRKIFIHNGSVWTKINKMLNENQYIVETPTTIAGVRGTTFYTFQNEDFSGVCQCEGVVNYSTHNNDYQGVHSKDSMVINKDGKTILFQPGELSFLNITHHHSSLDDSPLGQKDKGLTPVELELFRKAIEKKLM